MATTTKDARLPQPVDNYRLIIVGVCGAVHGVGVSAEEPTAWRAEPSLKAAVAKMDSGIIMDLTDKKKRDVYLCGIPAAPIVDFGVECEEVRMGKRYVPLPLYLDYWLNLGAKMEVVGL